MSSKKKKKFIKIQQRVSLLEIYINLMSAESTKYGDNRSLVAQRERIIKQDNSIWLSFISRS